MMCLSEKASAIVMSIVIAVSKLNSFTCPQKTPAFTQSVQE